MYVIWKSKKLTVIKAVKFVNPHSQYSMVVFLLIISLKVAVGSLTYFFLFFNITSKMLYK